MHNLDPNNSIVDKYNVSKHKSDKFPYTVYLCAGSQALKRSENKIYVMKWSNMQKTLKDDDEDSDNEGSDEDETIQPDMKFEVVPHKGSVNRIRSMHGTGIVATWNDEAEVGIYNVSEAANALDAKVEEVQKGKKKK